MFEEKNIDPDERLDTVLRTVHSDGGQKRVLVATRHSRNDSRGIQLELKYGSDGETTTTNGGGGGAMKVPFKKSHIRSSSCDVKFTRSCNENDASKFLKLPKKCHSRTSSRDMEQEFRARFSNAAPSSSSSHTRNNSDHLNIKYIINYLKSGPRGLLNEEVDDAASSSSGGGSGRRRGTKGHSRNHSYDRIYTAANNNAAFLPDSLDQEELAGRLAPLTTAQGGEGGGGSKDVNVRREAGKLLDIAAIELLVPASFESKFTHSRNNSKDFNMKLDELGVGGGAANLRHRRTNSRDLNVQPSSSGSVAESGGSVAGQTLLHFNNDDI